MSEDKTITKQIEELAAEFCDKYCKYPYIWDEEKEGEPLCDSDICINCPITRI